MYPPPNDQHLSPRPMRSRSQSLNESPMRYLQDTEEHPHMTSTPKVQAIELSALQKKESVQKFRFSVAAET